MDPCEKDKVDSSGQLTAQMREDLTFSAQVHFISRYLNLLKYNITNLYLARPETDILQTAVQSTGVRDSAQDARHQGVFLSS